MRAASNPEREAYLGETHVHTSSSLDFYLGFGNTVYNLGDKYITARGNEFRYANYEIEATNE